MLYSRTLLFIHPIYNSLHPLIPNSQSIPPSPHPTPWQSQICSLCLWVCFCFISFFFKCHANLCHSNIPLPYTRQTVVTLPYNSHRPVPLTPWAPGGQCRSPADLCDSRPQHPASVHQNTICSLLSFWVCDNFILSPCPDRHSKVRDLVCGRITSLCSLYFPICKMGIAFISSMEGGCKDSVRWVIRRTDHCD